MGQGVPFGVNIPSLDAYVPFLFKVIHIISSIIVTYIIFLVKILTPISSFQ